jgi:hypothetical protein
MLYLKELEKNKPSQHLAERGKQQRSAIQEEKNGKKFNEETFC